jgi:squalene-hopene/tetraprenyl-beta-curcumene cyclase
MTTMTQPVEGVDTDVLNSAASPEDVTARAAQAMHAALDALYTKLQGDGHWCAELEGDSILNSEYLLMKAILGQHRAPEATDEDLRRFDKMCAYLRMLQREDGTWGQYPGSPPDLSATVKAYFALKLFGGDDRDAPHMARAREAVLSLGGAERVNTFSNFYLACLGEVSWDACPTIPPEVILLPRWFPFHLTKVAAWTRTMILPLAICTATRPVRNVPSAQGIGELYLSERDRHRLTRTPGQRDPRGLASTFLGIDRALKLWQKSGILPLRGAAMSRSVQWLLERMTAETTDGLGAIFPPMVYIQIALQALGYERDHPVIVEAEKQLDRFIIEEEDHIRIQPCFSPVWDTGTALYAVTEAGRTIGDDPNVAKVCRWLCEQEVSHVGDWVANLRPEDRDMVMGPSGDAGGWAFEYRNDWYPDVDDTAMVAMALQRASGNADGADERRSRAAAKRAVRWMLAMQNDDGGWAAFDRTRDRPWMESVPFADHNAMQDPSCADITGRTVESLITNGVSPDHESIRRAVTYMLGEQRDFGAWWGRWGVNFIYGTWQAVGGLVRAGLQPQTHASLMRARNWLTSIQNDDGGFGESANSYIDESLAGQGPSTASQTAWGVMSLMALTKPEVVGEDESIRRAIAYLCDTQLTEDQPADAPRYVVPDPAGGWREQWFTGTGFPRVFYLRYHDYRHYFPLMALARYTRLTK